MIKEKKVLISINSRNISRYREMGYVLEKSGLSDKSDLLVDISEVSENSRIKITAICDICECENIIQFSKYWVNYHRHGYNFYSCFGCKNKKKEFTNIHKYGFKSFSQTEEFKEKFKETCLDRYGVDNPNKLVEVRGRIKETCLTKYGYVSPLGHPDILESNRVWMSSQEFVDKSKKTLLEKFGEDSYSKTQEFKDDLLINKEVIVDKIRQVFISKYGVDWVSKLSFVQEKIRLTKISNGFMVPDEYLSDFKIYQKLNRKYTNRVKKKLYEDWDGYDYYDGELISGNFSYSHTHRNYPTVDHKISVYYGFINGIPAEEISDISNLCITKRSINSSKRQIIESEFLLCE
jgi:hypothetical protein